MQPLVRVVKLNQMCYQKAFDIQMAIMANIKNSLKSGSTDVENTLILVEHKPVYTIGIRTKLYEDLDLEKRLRGMGADFVRTNRGGLITFHGLGQLVVYPILYLGSFDANKSVKCYVRRLESSIIDLCQSYGINGSVINGLPGVWVSGERKVAAIGIHCSHYVTSHGLAINCNVDLNWFEQIIPCGIADKKVTSLSNETNVNISVEEVMPKFLHSFQQNFNCVFNE